MMLMLSVIVPVYNIKDYIKASAESVLNQGFKNLELILVDDGSTDASGDICDELALADDRVKVIHKPNGGLSDARNAGIHAATGEYISFLDGDDLYAKGTLSGIMGLLVQKSPDVLIGRFQTFTGDGTRQIKDVSLDAELIDSADGEDLLKYLMSCKGFVYTACRYFLKRELVMKNKLFFKKGIYHEDEHWTPIMLSKANSFAAYSEIFYLYRVRANSITTTKTIKRPLDKLLIIEDFVAIKRTCNEGSVHERFFSYRINQLLKDIIGEYPSYCLKDVKTIAQRVAEIAKNNPDDMPIDSIIGRYAGACGAKNGIVIFALTIKLKRILRGKKPTW